MIRHPSYWALPGGRRFVDLLVAGRSGRVGTFIHEPFPTQILSQTIADAIEQEGLDRVLRIDGSNGSEELLARLTNEFGAKASTIDGFAFAIRFAVIIVWNVEELASFVKDLNRFVESVAIRKDAEAPRIMLVSRREEVLCSEPLWKRVPANNVLCPLDGASFAANLSTSKWTIGKRLAISVAIEVGAWDLDIVEQIAAAPLEQAIRPDCNLERWADCRVSLWKGVKPDWRAGSADHFGGQVSVHPLFLAANNPALLAKRVWRGQTAVLFPWLEEVRQEVVSRFRNRLQPDPRSFDQDIDSLDWGPICWQLKTEASKITDALHRARKLRNSIAHCRPVTWEEVRTCAGALSAVGLTGEGLGL